MRKLNIAIIGLGNIGSYLYKYLNFYIEKKFYNIAHQIIFTHKESSDSHIKYFKINKEKICCKRVTNCHLRAEF